MSKPLQFPSPDRDTIAQWAESRNTSDVIAAAIHAVSGPGRSAEAVWEDPTPAEWDQVRVAAENYLGAGVYMPSSNGVYSWGEERLTLGA